MASYSPEQQALISGYMQQRGTNPRVKNPYKLQLPKIPGLRIRRGVTTGKFGKQDIIVDASGRVYGMMAPNPNNVIGLSPDAAGTFLSVVRKKKGGAAAPSPTGTTPTGSGTGTTPATDEYTSYEKDYPWVADYLRSLKRNETDFTKRYTDVVLPGVTAGLNNLGKIGEGIANTYGGMVGTSPQQPGYVSNIYNAAASLSPAQVANGMGGASQVYDPNSVASRQETEQAQGAQAQANARYRSLMAGLSPVSTAQGILGNLATQAATISKAYADKRIEERMKLDQWIQEQKIATQSNLIKQQYNMALLGVSQSKLNLAQDQYNLDVKKYNSTGQKTDAELAADGFKRAPSNPGAKSASIINRTKVTSKEGNSWYKPNKAGSGTGGASGGPSANQKVNLIGNLNAAYNGTGQVDQNGMLLGLSPQATFRDMEGLDPQAQAVAAYVMQAVNAGYMKPTQQAIKALLFSAIPNPEYKTGDGRYSRQTGAKDKDGHPLKTANDVRNYFYNLVIGYMTGVK